MRVGHNLLVAALCELSGLAISTWASVAPRRGNVPQENGGGCRSNKRNLNVAELKSVMAFIGLLLRLIGYNMVSWYPKILSPQVRFLICRVCSFPSSMIVTQVTEVINDPLTPGGTTAEVPAGLAVAWAVRRTIHE